MKLKINGKEELMEANSLTISDLLDYKKIDSPEMVSVQLNGEFVKRDEFSLTKVFDNNEVEFLYFMGGGQ